jgi:hypothetical protein
MKKLTIALALAVALAVSTGPALADDVSASGTSASDASSGAVAGSAAQNGNQSQTTIFGAPQVPKQAPEVVTGPSNNTAMCIESTGFGFSVAGFGGSFSIPSENKDCAVNMRADLLVRAGYLQAAVAYLAQHDPSIKAALEQNGGTPPASPAAPAR